MQSVSRTRRWRGGLIAGAVALLATGCVFDLTEDLGDLAIVQAINDQGVMVGYTGEARLVHATRFDPGGVKVALDPYEGDHVTLHGINTANEIAGTVNGQKSSYRGDIYPVAWDGNGDLIDLRPVIPHAGKPGVSMTVWDINNDGVMVGTMSGVDETTTPPTPVEGIFTVNIRTNDVVTIPGSPGRLVPRAINDDEVIVGSNGDTQTRWTLQDGSYVGEALGDQNFRVTDINNHGDMAGFLYGSRTGGVWKKDGTAPIVLKLPDLPSAYSPLAAMISDTGIVVVRWNSLGGTTASRWKSADPETTPELFPLTDWQSIYPLDINGKGTVIGSAVRKDGVRHSVSWTVD